MSDTPIEQEILVVKAVIRCGSVAAAAVELFLSPHTVDSHIDHLRVKTSSHTFTQIALWMERVGLLKDHGERPAEGRFRRIDH